MAGWTLLKHPLRQAAGADHEVALTVSEMLLRIERDGLGAVRDYSRALDGWDPPSFRVGHDEIAAARGRVDDGFAAAFEESMAAVRRFARFQRSTLVDAELEVRQGVIAGQRQVPVAFVGSYLPGGRYPLVSSPLMTVLVPRVAGVDRIVACTPPAPGGEGVLPAMVWAADVCGADELYALGGVPALAAMAFGIDGMGPVDLLCGAGNAYVAEAKRQLYGRCGIDLLAGPSEVCVICDETADVELVAADLLGQAEHGPTSPATLITTDAAMGEAVLAEIDRQLPLLRTREVAEAAWRDFGAAYLARDREEAVAISDEVAAEHLEVHTADDDWYHDRLRNYGSLFLGSRATVAYSDKGFTGTNHTLPTRTAARYTGGLSVAPASSPVSSAPSPARASRWRSPACARSRSSAWSGWRRASGPWRSSSSSTCSSSRRRRSRAARAR
ncbi:MAG: histidinol dehydrogenase [Actinobacteria bacterium]|nr:histidinol dehydrogenase [Actinomycetota bacterium]